MASERNQSNPARASRSRATRRRPRPARAAFTLIEILTTLAVAALVGAIAIPRTMRLMDRVTVRAAVDAIASACALARSAAVARGTMVTVTVDPAHPTVRVTAGGDTLLDHPLDPDGPLTLSATRLRVVYAPTGLGFGASNTTIIARRRAAADTLYTSRLGRVRH